MELRKKQLQEMSKTLGAIKTGGNVYNYENVVHYITALGYETKHDEKEKSLQTYNNILENTSRDNQQEVSNLLNNIIKDIKRLNIDHTGTKQVAYSHGTYGNNGQLHVIELWSNGTVKKQYYIYYC